MLKVELDVEWERNEKNSFDQEEELKKYKLKFWEVMKWYFSYLLSVGEMSN